MRNLYQIGIQIGAESGPVTKPSQSAEGKTWSVSDYREAARKFAAEMMSTAAASEHVVVSYGINGSFPSASGSTPDVPKEKIREVWDRLTENPNDTSSGRTPRVYVALFDKTNKDNGGLIDEAFFLGAIEQTTRVETVKERSRTGLPWIIGGIAGGVALLAFGSRK